MILESMTLCVGPYQVIFVCQKGRGGPPIFVHLGPGGGLSLEKYGYVRLNPETWTSKCRGHLVLGDQTQKSKSNYKTKWL